MSLTHEVSRYPISSSVLSLFFVVYADLGSLGESSWLHMCYIHADYLKNSHVHPCSPWFMFCCLCLLSIVFSYHQKTVAHANAIFRWHRISQPPTFACSRPTNKGKQITTCQQSKTTWPPTEQILFLWTPVVSAVLPHQITDAHKSGIIQYRLSLQSHEFVLQSPAHSRPRPGQHKTADLLTNTGISSSPSLTTAPSGQAKLKAGHDFSKDSLRFRQSYSSEEGQILASFPPFFLGSSGLYLSSNKKTVDHGLVPSPWLAHRLRRLPAP